MSEPKSHNLKYSGLCPANCPRLEDCKKIRQPWRLLYALSCMPIGAAVRDWSGEWLQISEQAEGKEWRFSTGARRPWRTEISWLKVWLKLQISLKFMETVLLRLLSSWF